MPFRDIGDQLIGSILVLCTQNAVRSPMLEAALRTALGQKAYIASAGVEAGFVSPMIVDVMAEIGVDISGKESVAYDDLPADSYDMVVALSRPAYELARQIADDQACEIEYWQVAEPPAFGGDKTPAQLIDEYRSIRDDLVLHMKNRFHLDFPAINGTTSHRN